MQVNNLLFPNSNKSQPQSAQNVAGEISQLQLNDMLAKVTRVRILRDGVKEEELLGNEVLLDTSEPEALEGLKAALQVLEPEVKGITVHCMCYGSFAFEFFSGKHRVAVIALHHESSIRWSAWNSDAELKKNLDLLEWCASYGVHQPMQEFQKSIASQGEAYFISLRRKEWKAAMPQCLLPHWLEMIDPKDNTIAVSWMSTLEGALPDIDKRILSLLEWYGSRGGPWNGVPPYESAPGLLLLLLPTQHIVEVLSSAALSPEQLEGAARYFAGELFHLHKPTDFQLVPPELKKRLLQHVLKSGEMDNRAKAVHAFSEV